MSRQARVVVEGVPHHVTQRGNNRQNIFLADEDRHFYLKTLREKSEQFGLTITGYLPDDESRSPDRHPPPPRLTR